MGVCLPLPTCIMSIICAGGDETSSEGKGSDDSCGGMVGEGLVWWEAEGPWRGWWEKLCGRRAVGLGGGETRVGLTELSVARLRAA